MASIDSTEYTHEIENYEKTLHKSVIHMFRNGKMSDAIKICEEYYVSAGTNRRCTTYEDVEKVLIYICNGRTTSIQSKIVYAEKMSGRNNNYKIIHSEVDSSIRSSTEGELVDAFNHTVTMNNVTSLNSYDLKHACFKNTPYFWDEDQLKVLNNARENAFEINDAIEIVKVNHEEFFSRMFQARGLPWPYDISDENVYMRDSYIKHN